MQLPPERDSLERKNRPPIGRILALVCRCAAPPTIRDRIANPSALVRRRAQFSNSARSASVNTISAARGAGTN
jgi:hypothetical protein